MMSGAFTGMRKPPSGNSGQCPVSIIRPAERMARENYSRFIAKRPHRCNPNRFRVKQESVHNDFLFYFC